jgi:hypothetical protein
MEFIDDIEDNLEYHPNLQLRIPKSYGRSCCICGNNDTYIYKGISIWSRYKDEDGNLTKEWSCHNCHRKKKSNKVAIIKCRLCGSSETRKLSNGKPIWVKDTDINRKPTGDFICYKCAYEDNRLTCGHTNRILKYYDNRGRWTGKRFCKKCTTNINQIIRH